MAESPERVASVFADKQAKAEAAKERRQKSRREYAERERKKAQAAMGEIDVLDPHVLRMRWWDAYVGPANGNGVKASEIAGYAECQWRSASAKNRRHFAARLAKLADEKLNRSTLIEELHHDSQGVGEYIAWAGSSPDIVQTIENLRDAGQLRQLIGAEVSQFGTKLKFRDPQKALDTLVKIAGIAAPVKSNVTISLDGMTPAQIHEKAEEIKACIIERQQKLLNLPSNDDDEILEADLVDEEDIDDDSADD